MGIINKLFIKIVKEKYPCRNCLVVNTCWDDCDKIKNHFHSSSTYKNDWDQRISKLLLNNDEDINCPFCGFILTKQQLDKSFNVYENDHKYDYKCTNCTFERQQ